MPTALRRRLSSPNASDRRVAAATVSEQPNRHFKRQTTCWIRRLQSAIARNRPLSAGLLRLGLEDSCQMLLVPRHVGLDARHLHHVYTEEGRQRTHPEELMCLVEGGVHRADPLALEVGGRVV